MALIQPASPEPSEPGHGRSRKAVRYAVPVAVAGVAAATISLVPALADAGDPSLPPVTAQQLLARIAGSDTRALDGNVQVSSDLGLPSALSGAGAGLFGGGAPAGSDSGSGSGSPAAPESRLPQLLIGSHRLHVAADGPDRQKVSLIEQAAEYSVIRDGDQLWAYDSRTDQAYHQTLQQRPAGAHQQIPEGFPATPQAAAKAVLDAADGTAAITVDGTARVAGRSAYQLVITPEHADTTTVGSVRIAVDSSTGVPLRFTLAAKGGGKAVVDIRFTKVAFTAPAAKTFTFTPGKGVKVTEGGKDASGAAAGKLPGKQGGEAATVRPTVVGAGWDTIAVVKAPGGLPAGAAKNGKGDRSGDGASLLESFGTKVSGPYGTGTLFHTRLVNALLTDDGTVYAGAVTPAALEAAASAAQ